MKHSQNIFCGRKDRVTINGKFHRHPRVSDTLAIQIENYADKMAERRDKRYARGQ